MRHFLLSVIISMVTVGGASAQVVRLFSSEPVRVGARGAGLADAYTASIADAFSLYWNPAGLAYLAHNAIIMDHSFEKTINSFNENVTLPLQIRSGEVIGIGATVNHVGYGGGTDGGFRAIQYGYDLGYGREILPGFSLGAAVGVRYASATGSHLWGVSSSIGACYYPSEEVSYGLSYSGIGSGIRYATDGSATSFTNENLPHRLQAGAELRFPSSEGERLFTLAIENEKIFGQSGLRYGVAVEALPFRFLALRGGYVVEPDIQYARFGAGLRADRFQIDYSISPSKFTDEAYHISLAIDLGRQ